MKTKQTKFKIGDKVLLLDNLSKSEIVSNVWFERKVRLYPVYYDYSELEKKIAPNYEYEMVAINDKVYYADELTFYSTPIQKLAERLEELETKSQIIEIKK